MLSVPLLDIIDIILSSGLPPVVVSAVTTLTDTIRTHWAMHPLPFQMDETAGDHPARFGRSTPWVCRVSDQPMCMY